MDMDWIAANWWVFLVVLLTMVVWPVTWKLDAMQEDLRLLRLQMNRLTLAPPSDEDRERVERDADLSDLTPEDFKAIDRAYGARWRYENPDQGDAKKA